LTYVNRMPDSQVKLVPMESSPPAERMRKLASKLLVVQLVFLFVALGSIGMTLLVSWKLEGSAAAINDAGSLRMRAWRLAYLASQDSAAALARDAAEVRASIVDFEAVFATLRRGDPARPLFLPRSEQVTSQLGALENEWRLLAAHLDRAASGGSPPARVEVERFVSLVNALVATIEDDIADTTSVLRQAELALVGLAIAGTVALVYLSFLLVIRPLTRLHEGIERVASGDLSVRVPVETRDEFGQLSAGFNAMAARLESAYQTLESKVEEKTRSLADRNARLATLYDMAAFLARAQPLSSMCEGFLARVQTAFGAASAAVRLTGNDGKLHLYATRELPQAFVDAEQCLAECACGDSAGAGRTVVHLLDKPATPVTLPHCRKAGFASVAAVPIEAQSEVVGVFNLFFREPRLVNADERHLLDTLGQHLGAALGNARVAALEKEVAISEERNLLAQELHDSIAQSLAFLNLQVQMLGAEMKGGDPARARDTLGEIREGVQECYGDVRELLTHFRTRLAPADLVQALGSMVAKFEKRTGIAARFVARGSAVALAPDRQLQVLHVVQEALSNARKHAQCSRVDVLLDAGPVYCVTVRDDGRGFDPAVASRLEDHVGLRIMRERASRAGGGVEVTSSPGEGTAVVLSVPVSERQAA
jgi:two-component system nitrate/nitrite sensor histidine kinase NarX